MNKKSSAYVAVMFQQHATTVYRRRNQLMCRANSLKKAIRNIIEHTEHGKVKKLNLCVT
jgi:hypothetical protein